MAKTNTTQSPAARDIGIVVAAPSKACQDQLCPFHGHLKVRGQQFVGKVVSNKMTGTVVVEKEHARYLSKFERYERRTSRYAVHSPPCIAPKIGDEVRIMECRPISKTVSFVVVENKGGGAA
ncbi:MAG: 30S ribosomal protein S17 [Euryarchaeota archaeon]|nr:30S ribosomal protein S17 [Euryarchaeota archaeon]